MKRQNFIFIVLIAALVMTLILIGKKPSKIGEKEVHHMNSKKTQIVQEEQSKTEPKKETTPSRRPNSTITPKEMSSLKSNLPDKNTVKEEVIKNPHSTPQSLTKFARSMGPLMEKALKNGDDAMVLVNELNDCAMDETAAQTARALCVVNSERLAKTHPQLKGKAGEMRANVSPGVRKLLERRDAMMNN